MLSLRRTFLRDARGWLFALLLGVASFYLNGQPVSVGWGVEFVFGSVLPLAALRILAPAQVIAAASLGAARTVTLWHHPFAWMVWSAEALFLVALGRRRALLRLDVLFWLALGAPLLWLTYGKVLHLDDTSLLLVVLKQALNGALNVALAELCYAGLLLASKPSGFRQSLPPLSLEALLLSVTTAATLVPALLFLRVDTPTRERAIRDAVALRLNTQLHWANRQLSEGLAEGGVKGRGLAAGEPLAVPGGAPPPDPQIVVGSLLADAQVPVLLIDPAGRHSVTVPQNLAAWEVEAGFQVPANGAARQVQSPRSYGVPLMSSALETAFIASQAADALPGWRLVAIAKAPDEILAQRRIQSRLLAGLSCMLLAAIGAAFVIAVRTRRSLDSIAGAAADLAALGGAPAKVRELIVEELSEVARRVMRSSSHLEREREALLTNRRRLQAIANHAPVVIYAIRLGGNDSGALSYVSNTLETVLGYTAEQVAVANWWADSLHPDDRAACLAANRDLSAGRVLTHEYRIRHGLGHYLWVYDCLTVEEDGCEAVGIIIDISDKRAAAEKLVQASKMESLGRMAAGVAHELNQPLNFVRLAAENLRVRLKSGNIDHEKANEKVELIISQVDRAGGIVNEVSSFGRMDSQTLEQLDVVEMVRDVIGLLEVQFALQDIAIILEAVAGRHIVLAQPRRLSQVVLNLLLNARDAIATRREVEGDVPGTIAVAVSDIEGMVSIAVSDNGTGIPADKLAMLFEPFFTTKAPRKGTGLGLSISYGIVSELRGAIAAENIPDGARFTVTLPRHSAMAFE